MTAQSERPTAGSSGSDRASLDVTALAERISSPTVILDKTGVVSYANLAAAWMLGRSAPSLHGVDAFSLVHPEDRKRLRGELIRLVDGKADCAPFDFRLRAVDGTWKTVSALSSNLLDVPGAGGILVSAADVTERRAYEQSLRELAYRDPITGLPNRRGLEDHLGQAMATERPVAVAFLDIDHLRRVNDCLGHAAGDHVLRASGERLNSLVPRQSFLAHFGADMFVAVVVGMSPARAERLTWEFIRTLGDPLFVSGHELHLSASVGLAVRDAASTPEGLLRDADAALTCAKSVRRGGVVVFTEDLRAEAIERLRLETDLRHAIDERKTTVHFQPIVRLADGQVVGAEALLRWMRPQGAEVNASTIVAIAEESGLMEAITDQVLSESLSAVASGLVPKVNINLSPRQLLDPSLSRRIHRTLKTAGVPPERLGFEVTETVVIENFDLARDILHRLRRIGCAVGLDDFGTGYSSLGYLRQLPVDFLKLDRQLVAEIDSDAQAGQIAGTIVALARTLTLSTVAEGVERPTQAEALVQLGCDQGQGWLYGRPEPPAYPVATLPPERRG